MNTEITNSRWVDLSEVVTIPNGQLVVVENHGEYHLARYDKQKDVWVEENTGVIGMGGRVVLMVPEAPGVTVPQDFTKGRISVFENGDLTIHVKPGYDYEADLACLKDKFFVGSIAGKTWRPRIDFGAFMKAYLCACAKAGLHDVTINTDYFLDSFK